MPAYRFTWSTFDDATVSALSRVIGGPADAGRARPWLAERVKRPTLDFARAAKHVLSRVWLPKHPRVAMEACEALHAWGIGPLGPARTDEACARDVDECRSQGARQGSTPHSAPSLTPRIS